MNLITVLLQRLHILNKTIEDVKALQIISDVFKCHPEKGYFQHAKNRYSYVLNFRFWNVCKRLLMSEAACFMPNLTSSLCPRFPIHVIKTVRMRLKEAIRLMDQDEVFQKNLKIIVLVRDPRGVINSGNSIEWCSPHTPCGNPRSLCEEMEEDYKESLALRRRDPTRIHLVRYEDLSMDPFGVTDEIMDFLALPKMPHVEKFLEDHTGSNREETKLKLGQKITNNEIKIAMEVKSADPHTIKATSSRALPFQWKETLEEKTMLEVQEVCEKAINNFGYRRLKGNDDWDNENLNFLTKTREELWPLKPTKSVINKF